MTDNRAMPYYTPSNPPPRIRRRTFPLRSVLMLIAALTLAALAFFLLYGVI